MYYTVGQMTGRVLSLVPPSDGRFTVERHCGATSFRFFASPEMTTILEFLVREPSSVEWKRVAMHLDTDMDASLFIQRKLVEGDRAALSALRDCRAVALQGGPGLVVLEYRPFAECYVVSRYLPKPR